MNIILLTVTSFAITFICIVKYIHPACHLGFSDNEKSKLAYFSKFWWWLVTGLSLKEYSAIHRHNHVHAMLKWDNGIPPNGVLLRARMYLDQRKNKKMIEDYGIKSPNTWIDINIYQNYHYLGPLVYLLILLTVIGASGIVVWILQLLLIVFLCSESVNAKDCSSDLCNSELMMLCKTKTFYG